MITMGEFYAALGGFLVGLFVAAMAAVKDDSARLHMTVIRTRAALRAKEAAASKVNRYDR